jgi:succinate dehydrogenase/fumarate reductase flavoprotein subunit
LRTAFGPIIDRLASNGIDLTSAPIEVAPIAHYHMGGIRVDSAFETRIGGLFAAGEAVGGANGANRLSGTAITEALVFGRRAGLAAAEHARHMGMQVCNKDMTSAAQSPGGGDECGSSNPAALIAQLQSVMSELVGPFRTEVGLTRALEEIADLREGLGPEPKTSAGFFDTLRLDWFDARNMLLVAEAVARAALARQESRGAHQREDYVGVDPQWSLHQVLRLEAGHLLLDRVRSSNAVVVAAQ